MDDDINIVNSDKNLAELLTKEDLDPYSVEELKSRKILLQQEITRTEAKIKASKDHLNAAENLFK